MRRIEAAYALLAAERALGLPSLYGYDFSRAVLGEEHAPRTLLHDLARNTGRCARHLERAASRRGEHARVDENRAIRRLCLFARRIAREVEL